MTLRISIFCVLASTIATHASSVMVTDLGARPFVSIAGAPGVVLLAGVSACDECTQAIALPFPSQWFGRAITNIAISANGQINMDARAAAHCCDAPAIPAADGNDDAIFLVKGDLDPGLAGDIYALELGAPGARTFTVEFQGVQLFMPVPTPIEAQVIFFESPPGRIELAWGAGSLSGQAISAGIEDAGGFDGAAAIAGTIFDANGRATMWPSGRACRFEPRCAGDCIAPITLASAVVGVAPMRTAIATLALDTSACGFDSVTPACAPPGGDADDLLVQVRAPFSGTMRVRTCVAATFDTILTAMDGACGAAVIACNDDTCGAGAEIVFAIVAGRTYTIALDGAAGATGSADVSFELTEDGCGDCASPIGWLPQSIGAPGLRVASNSFQIDTSACGGVDSHAPSCGGGGADAVIEFLAPFDGIASAETCATALDTLLVALDGGCGAPEIDCNDNDPACAAAGASRITFAIAQGHQYSIVLDSDGGGSFAALLDLALTELPECGTCAAPQPVVLEFSGLPGGRRASGIATTSTALCLQDSYSPPMGCIGSGAFDGDDSILEFTAPFAGDATITTCGGATFDTVLVALAGACTAAPALIACNDDSGCADQASTLSFAVVAGALYTIVVDGFDGAVGVADVMIEIVEPPCAVPGTCADPIVLVPSIIGMPGSRASSDIVPINTALCMLDNHALSCRVVAARDVIVGFTAPFDGEALASTCNGATFDTALAALDGGCGAPELECADDTCGPVGVMVFSEVRFAIQSGRTYSIVVDGAGIGTADLAVDLFERACLSAMCGDCDINGSAPDILDALEAARINLGLIMPTPQQQTCCDVDSSATITVLDALQIAQDSVGLSVTLLCP